MRCFDGPLNNFMQIMQLYQTEEDYGRTIFLNRLKDFMKDRKSKKKLKKSLQKMFIKLS